MGCPQLEATLTILVGQSSKETNVLALNGTTAKHCLLDIEHILVGQGANDSLVQICLVHSSNLTDASCPVFDVNEFEDTVDTSKLLAACEKIDPVKECCAPTCENAILEAAARIASKASDLLSTDGAHDLLPDRLSKVYDCKNIVLRWLATCPLVFPDMKHVAMGCGNEISNRTACGTAMESYVAHLQKQSLITNFQTLDCAASLGMKLRKSNIIEDVYSLCHTSLKDFSLQDVKIPALPAAAYAESGLYHDNVMLSLLLASRMVLMMLL
ncbi:hypothetical protein C1H46_021026 [Malus baccata]|uniref:Uncharacterized protein n=1 Tax=Malus baccata TaxID=106549 RepID=A0A540M3M9_MALBA|nr:hypothetical protein C1H46_021026 [Malus baccata]